MKPKNLIISLFLFLLLSSCNLFKADSGTLEALLVGVFGRATSTDSGTSTGTGASTGTGTSTGSGTGTSSNIPAPSISYSGTSPYIYFFGDSVSLVATVTGTISSCTVNPSLPIGLSISNSDCSITGTPTTGTFPMTYTITASNSAGSSVVTIIIKIQSTTALRVFGQNGSFTSNGGTNTASGLRYPKGISVDSSGNLYITQGGLVANRVTYYSSGSTTATDVYGQFGSFTCSVDRNNGSCATGTPSAGNLYQPEGITLDSNYNLYISDSGNSRILYYTSGSTTPTRVYGQFGSFTCGVGLNGGGCSSTSANANNLGFPVGIALDSLGNLYAVDTSPNRVLFYPSGSTTATRVYGQYGSFTCGQARNNGLCAIGTASADNLNQPRGVAVDSLGNLYIADTDNHRVLYYSSGSTTATRVYGQFGSFTCFVSRNNGSCVSGVTSPDNLYNPMGVAIDSADNLYVADTNNNRVLFYLSGSTTPTRVYGQYGSFTCNFNNNNNGSCASGIPSANNLDSPRAMAVDTLGNLYIVDGSNNRVLMY